VRAVTVKADQERPAEYSHVYCEAQLSTGEWVPLDAARSDPALGKAPEYYWQRQDWPLTPGASANAYLNGYGRPAMKRRFGMGAQTILLVKRRGFPRARRGLGQDDFASQYGITQAEYNADQAGYTPSSSSSFSNYMPEITAALAATPAILGGAAQVIKASNTPGLPYAGIVGGTSGVAAPSVSLSGSSGWVVGLGLLVIAAFAFSRRG
jgi:hypothetical protein